MKANPLIKYKFDPRPSIVFRSKKNTALVDVVNKYQTITRHCVCGDKEEDILFDKDRYGVQLSFVLCKNCSVVRSLNKMSDEDLSSFYANEYRKLYFDMEIPKTNLIEGEQRPRGRAIIGILNKSGELFVDRMVLEIGAGAGGILDEFHINGGITTAIEPSVQYCEYMRAETKHTVIEGMLSDSEDARFLGNKYKVIVISHVLEHVNDPLDFLIKARKLLSDDGVIYIEVPSLTKIGLSNDRFLDFFHVAHPWTFSKNGLLRLCYEVGLEPVYVDNNIRVLLKRSELSTDAVKCDYKLVYFSLIVQDLMSRFRFLGIKRRLLQKISKIMPLSIKSVIKSFLNA